METFTAVKDFVHNPNYYEQRQKALRSLNIDTIDQPIVELISSFTKLTYCFTLQSCYGHFVDDIQTDAKNTEPLPVPGVVAWVEYRIAYIALCNISKSIMRIGKRSCAISSKVSQKSKRMRGG